MPRRGLTPNPFNDYRLRAAVRAGLLTGFAALGVFMTVAEVVQGLGFAGSRPVLVVGLAVALALGAWKAIRATSGLRTFAVRLNGDGRVTVRVGDFAENVRHYPGASCAFGANDEFSVRGLHADSAHAAFLATFFPAADEQARQARLDEARSHSELPLAAGAGSSQLGRYSYGTVVCLPFLVDGEVAARNAFLVANSTRQAHGFFADPDEVLDDPVLRVLDYHRRARLYSETVVFSLIGTGHSHSHNPMQSVFHLIDTYLAQSRRHDAGRRLIGHMVISVSEHLVVEQGFDLEAVHLYLKARARMEHHRDD